jgi:hypothetical protein
MKTKSPEKSMLFFHDFKTYFSISKQIRVFARMEVQILWKLFFKTVGVEVGENIQAETIADSRTTTAGRTYFTVCASRTPKSVAFGERAIINIS